MVRKMRVDASPRHVLGGGSRNADLGRGALPAFSASWEERKGLHFLPDRAALPVLLPACTSRAGRGALEQVVSVPAAGRCLYVTWVGGKRKALPSSGSARLPESLSWGARSRCVCSRCVCSRCACSRCAQLRLHGPGVHSPGMCDTALHGPGVHGPAVHGPGGMAQAHGTQLCPVQLCMAQACAVQLCVVQVRMVDGCMVTVARS